MGNCCGKPATLAPSSPRIPLEGGMVMVETEARPTPAPPTPTLLVPVPLTPVHRARAPPARSSYSLPQSATESSTRNSRSTSILGDRASSLSSHHQRPRAQSVAFSGRSMSSERQTGAQAFADASVYPGRGQLASTVHQVLSNHPKFRILVVGKIGSGKTSLINAVFNVDPSAAPETVSGKPDINIELEFQPEDNRYLIAHECSGFEHRDPQSLQAIREFILRRTEPSRPTREKLHVIWICVPAHDAISGDIGEGVKEILEMKRVPVIVVLTKFDLVVSRISSESGGRSSHHEERARNWAYTRCEESCRSLFRAEPKDVPVEIVSVPFGYPIGKLVTTTDRFMMGLHNSLTRSIVQEKPRVAPVPLVWSVASRVSQDIIIQACIEVGRSRYWRNLWYNLDFIEQPLKNCIDVIHIDIIEIWNLNDKARYLSSMEFKEKMSYVVKDLTGSTMGMSLSPDTIGPEEEFAEWLHGTYQYRDTNVQCLMGYIVDLMVILDQLFRSNGGNVSAHDIHWSVDTHVSFGRRDRIHQDIRDFVAEAFASLSAFPGRDLVLEKIIDLIRQNCVAPSTSTHYSADLVATPEFVEQGNTQ